MIASQVEREDNSSIRPELRRTDHQGNSLTASSINVREKAEQSLPGGFKEGSGSSTAQLAANLNQSHGATSLIRLATLLNGGPRAAAQFRLTSAVSQPDGAAPPKPFQRRQFALEQSIRPLQRMKAPVIQRIKDDPEILASYEIPSTAGIDVSDEMKEFLSNNIATLKPLVNRGPGNFRQLYGYLNFDTNPDQRLINLFGYRNYVDNTALNLRVDRATDADTEFLSRIATGVATYGSIGAYVQSMKNKAPVLREIVDVSPVALGVVDAILTSGGKEELTKGAQSIQALLPAFLITPPGANTSAWVWGPGNKGSVAENEIYHVEKHVLYIGGEASASREPWQWKGLLNYTVSYDHDIAGLGLDPLVLNPIQQVFGDTGRLDTEQKYETFFVDRNYQAVPEVRQMLLNKTRPLYVNYVQQLTNGMPRKVTSRDNTTHRVHGQVNTGGEDVFIIGKVLNGGLTISSAYIPFQDEDGILTPHRAW